jgi:hypothetical protein
MGLRTEMVQARAAGLAAGRGNDPPTTCPYGGDRPLVRWVWLKGYADARRARGAHLPSTDPDAAATDTPDAPE